MDNWNYLEEFVQEHVGNLFPIMVTKWPWALIHYTTTIAAHSSENYKINNMFQSKDYFLNTSNSMEFCCVF